MKSRSSAEVWYSGKLPGRRAGERPDGQVEAGRVELPLVPAPGLPLVHLGGIARVAQDELSGPIDLRVAPAALLVGQRARIANAQAHEPVLHALQALLVAREPGDRADRAGAEEEAVRVAKRPAREVLRERGHQHQSREIVVRHRRVAGVARDEHLVCGLARHESLGVGQRAVLERRVDADLVLALRKRLEPAVLKAEAPVRGVVGVAERDPVGVLGEREQVLLQLGERQPLPHGDAVAEDVQVRVGEVDDPIAIRPRDPGLGDVPLLGDDPVEHLGPGRDLGGLQRHSLADQPERLPEPVARDAAADRKELAGELVHLLPDVVSRRQSLKVDTRHPPAQL